MRSYLFLPSFALCLVLLYMPSSGISEGAPNDVDSDIQTERQIIQLTESGIEPTTIDMKQRNGAAYFLNNTGLPMTVVLQSTGVDTTCLSSTMRLQKDGTVRANAPIAPKDFASTCFNKAGTHEFTVYGLSSAPEGIKGSIIVQ